MNIRLPDEVKYIITTLEENGHEAYAVGGCIRDAVLSIEPKDWDICTSALPEQTMKVFKESRIIETGLKHGTITLILNNKHFEITTYHCSNKLISSLKEDLSRRDFTINAMAYNPRTGIVDFFGGVSDINNQIIRCTQGADERLKEDALRIIRALRFASVSGFKIEDATSEAIFRNKGLLKNIAVERISVELNKMIAGANVGDILLRFTPVISEIIPEINDMIGFEQNNPYHYLDVWKHTVRSITKAPEDVVLRLTMLFHDIGKPGCYTEADGIGHFYGHQKVSRAMAEEILLRLKYDNDTISAVTELVLYHDADVNLKGKNIKRWLNRLGEERLRQLIEIKRADAMAQSEKSRKIKIGKLYEILLKIDEIIEQQQCFSLKDLAINGRDLIKAGVPQGREIGKVLNYLLDMVIDGQIENDKEKLLETAKNFLQ